MGPMLTMHIEEDGSELVLTHDGDRLVARHGGRDPEPLGNGPLYVVWVLLPGRQGVPRLRTVFICDELGADRVVIDTPCVKGETHETYAGRSVPWMLTGLDLFRPGTVKARWEVKHESGWETLGEQSLLLEEWGYVAEDSGFMTGDELREHRARRKREG